MGDKDSKTKKLSKTSKAIVIFTGLLWLIYDIFPAINEGRNDTISESIRNWSRYTWVIPFLWGAITGHLFINIGQPDNYKTLFYILGGVFLTLICLNLITYFVLDWQVPLWYRILMLFSGIALGVLLWPQDP